MFEEYKTLVLNFYLEMKEKGFLSSDMENPGREKLKNECLLKFSKKNSTKDKDLIQIFFDPKNECNDPIRSIEKYDLDKFRPLVAFLRREKNVRDDKNVKLLAWLLDCPSYEDWRNGVSFPVIKPPVDDTLPPPTVVEPPIFAPPLSDQNSSIPIQQILISCSVFILIGICFYQFRENKISSFNTLFSSGNEKCMYWTGDKYQPVSCDESLNGVSTIPINENKVWKFRRITQPDTLTKYALGKVWYAKRYGKIEFFTDSGAHPADDNKRLLPVTTYIITKYASYDRYLLTMFYWFIGIIVFSLLFGVSAVYFGKSVKKRSNANEKRKIQVAA